MEIAKMLVLSTAHLQPATCNGYMADTLAAYEKAEFGWFMNVPCDGETLAEKDYPADLAIVLAFASGAGMQWVMFDRDADELAALPVYDWNNA